MDKLPKILVRLTVIFTAIYFAVVYALAWYGIEFFNDGYIILFELCICSFISVQGKYHCKYIKYTAWNLTLADTITRIDGEYDILPIEYAILIPVFFLFLSWFVPFTLALHHYYNARKLIKRKNEVQQRRTEED